MKPTPFKFRVVKDPDSTMEVEFCSILEKTEHFIVLLLGFKDREYYNYSAGSVEGFNYLSFSRGPLLPDELEIIFEDLRDEEWFNVATGYDKDQFYIVFRRNKIQ